MQGTRGDDLLAAQGFLHTAFSVPFERPAVHPEDIE